MATANSKRCKIDRRCSWRKKSRPGAWKKSFVEIEIFFSSFLFTIELELFCSNAKRPRWSSTVASNLLDKIGKNYFLSIEIFNENQTRQISYHSASIVRRRQKIIRANRETNASYFIRVRIINLNRSAASNVVKKTTRILITSSQQMARTFDRRCQSANFWTKSKISRQRKVLGFFRSEIFQYSKLAGQ